MTTLDKQYKEDVSLTPMQVLSEIVYRYHIDERGGGPEGLYYTHKEVEGEFLLRNLPKLLVEIDANYDNYT